MFNEKKRAAGGGVFVCVQDDMNVKIVLNFLTSHKSFILATLCIPWHHHPFFCKGDGLCSA